MTLNITLVSRWGIHQSADSRLLDADRRTPLSEESPKLLQLSYQDWIGNVTYCGIGRWRGNDTSRWMKTWLTHQFGEQRSFPQVIETIRLEGTKWLRDISHFASGPLPHTFVLTGFVHGRPLIALISNCQRLDAPGLATPVTDLYVTTARVHNRRLVITGIPLAVDAADSALLESFARQDADSYDVQRAFSRVNARASRSPHANGAISESCWVFSNAPDGSSNGQLYGSVKGEFVPITLLSGMNLLGQVKLNEAPGRSVQVLSSTFVSSESLQRKKRIECNPRVIDPQDGSETPVQLTDVGHLGGGTSRVHSTNSAGNATGESFLTPAGPSHAFYWSDGEMHDIGTLGGGTSMGKDISDVGAIVGSSGLPNGDNRAFVWSADKGFLELGTLGGRHSNAAAVNAVGQVVGSSWTIAGEHPTDPQERGFVWDASGGMRSLGALGDSWSRAHDINDRGEVVGISPVQGFTHGFFRLAEGELLDIGTLGGESCNVLALNNTGQVVGMSETPDLQHRPFVWSLSDGIRELAIPGKVYIRGIDDNGIIVGDTELDIGTRSFVFSEAQGFHLLPSYDHHRSEALAICTASFISGQIIGREMHCHGVIWSLRKV